MTSTTTVPGRGWSVGRTAVAVLVVAMAAMWAYVLYLAFGPGRQDPPDRLADPAFAAAAQDRCDAALDAVALLPGALTAASPAERAAIIDEANVRFGAMLDDLATVAPTGEDGEIVAVWLADWRTYLDDRAAYADAVRTDPEARLLVSAKGNEQITEHIDAFAADNHMPACATPTDV